jgi:hypothetical protein
MSKKSASKKKVKLARKRAAKKQPTKLQTTETSIPAVNGNPFRKDSAYGRIYDVLASAPEGMTRDDLLQRAVKVTRKDKEHASFDLAVVLSAKDSPTGKRHRSCRPGYWIEKTPDGLLKLRTN